VFFLVDLNLWEKGWADKGSITGVRKDIFFKFLLSDFFKNFPFTSIFSLSIFCVKYFYALLRIIDELLEDERLLEKKLNDDYFDGFKFIVFDLRMTGVWITGSFRVLSSLI